MLKLDKHTIYKSYFLLSVIALGVSLAIGWITRQQPAMRLGREMALAGMSAGIVLFILGLLTWLTGSPSPKRAKRLGHAEAEKLLDIIEHSKVGPLLIDAPKGVVIRINELIEDLDVGERPKCEAILDKLYQLTPACTLPQNYKEHVLNWYQYDLCIIAVKENIEFAEKIKNALLDRHPGCRIYLDAADGVWVRGTGLIERVFYAGSWKCLVLLSDDAVKHPIRKEELNNAMRRNHTHVNEEACGDYLMPIPLDEAGLKHMREEPYLSKYAKHVAIIDDHDYLCKVIVDTLSTFIKKSTVYDHLADLYLRKHKDVESNHPQEHFAIALSFPSARQVIVQAVAEELEKLIPGEKVFYYPNQEIELAGIKLDARLQSYYRDQTELVVVFLCAEYASSQWCRLEWTVILDLLKHGSRKPMLLRFDNAPIPRLPSNYGYVYCQHLTPRAIAEKIMQKLMLNRQH